LPLLPPNSIFEIHVPQRGSYPQSSKSRLGQTVSWHDGTMTEEFFLSFTDVAEALECSIEDVKALVRQGDLTVESGPFPTVSHAELSRYIQMIRHEHLALGIGGGNRIDFEMLRPREN
jgi:hypothetical protein